MSRLNQHADFAVVAVEDDRVFVVDENLGGKSVTNDAEWVWACVATQWPARRLIYRDSIGRWDEIVIDGDGAAGFRPYSEHLPDTGI